MGSILRSDPWETQFIRSRDNCRLAAVGRDGWPHCVPVGYLYKNGAFYIPSDRHSRKVSNLKENKRACIVIDDEDTETGLMIQAIVRIAVGRDFSRLRTWMVSKTGWTIGSGSVILILRPVRRARWRLKPKSG